MAVVNSNGTGGGNLSAAGTWDAGVPQNTDTVNILAGDTVIINEDSNAIGPFSMTATSSIISSGGFILNIDGTASFDGTIGGSFGDITVAGHCTIASGITWSQAVYLILDGTTDLSSADTDLATLSLGINTADTITLTSDLYYGDFTVTTGIFDQDDFTAYAAGDYTQIDGKVDTGTGELVVGGVVDYTLRDAATLNLTMTDLASPGNATINWASQTKVLSRLTIAAGAAVATSGTTWTKKLAGAGALTVSNGHYFKIYAGTAGWWTCTGKVLTGGTGYVIFDRCSAAPGGSGIDIDGRLDIITIASHAITMDAYLNLYGNDLTVKSDGAGGIMTLDMAGYSLTDAAVEIGDSNSTGSAILKLGEASHSILSLAAGDPAVNTQNELLFESSDVLGSGTIDGDGIAITSDDANLVNGTIQNVAVAAGVLNLWGVIDGGSNTGDLRNHDGAEVGAAA